MTPFSALLLFGAGVPLLIGIVIVADIRGCFALDPFPTSQRKLTGLVLLFATLFLAVLVPAVSLDQDVSTANLRLRDVFFMQGVFAGFLLLWWLLSGRPPLLEYAQLRSARPLVEAGSGALLGFLGWVMTLLVAILTAMILSVLGHGPSEGAVLPPLVRWLARLPVEGRLLIVASAMTVEELFFRAFLQRRFGPWAASILFVLAHMGYGEPLVLVGLFAITGILAASYARAGSIVASVVAHGVFDAIQLLIVLPEAAQRMPG